MPYRVLYSLILWMHFSIKVTSSDSFSLCPVDIKLPSPISIYSFPITYKKATAVSCKSEVQRINLPKVKQSARVTQEQRYRYREVL